MTAMINQLIHQLVKRSLLKPFMEQYNYSVSGISCWMTLQYLSGLLKGEIWASLKPAKCFRTPSALVVLQVHFFNCLILHFLDWAAVLRFLQLISSTWLSLTLIGWRLHFRPQNTIQVDNWFVSFYLLQWTVQCNKI